MEALKMHFDCSDLNGDESVYASRNGEKNIAFVAISPNGNITTYKSDNYPDELLGEEIMMLCCVKYKDNSLPPELNNNKYFIGASEYARGIVIELIVASITVILCVIFLVIYWLLFQDSEKLLIIGAIICLPVIFFIISVFKARWRVPKGK